MSANAIRWPSTGELNRRVLIRRWTSQANVSMGITETFDAGIARWAKIQPVSGAAFWGGEQTEEKVTHRVWLRWANDTQPDDITQQHVVDYKNQRYRVLRSVNVEDADQFTMLEVKLLGNIS